MVVGILILYAGIRMLKESIDGILHPSDMKVSMLMVLIVAGTAVTKFCLGMYTIKIGKSVESEVLLAVEKTEGMIRFSRDLRFCHL